MASGLMSFLSEALRLEGKPRICLFSIDVYKRSYPASNLFVTMATTISTIGFGLLLAYLAQFVPFNNLLGRVTIPKSQLLRWKDDEYLNNNCIVHQTANACEDVKIHFASNTAFLACGDPKGRTAWYPGAGRHDAKNRQDFREKLFNYDMKTKKTTELRIDGLEGDFVTHGLDVIDLPGDKSKVSLVIWTERVTSTN